MIIRKKLMLGPLGVFVLSITMLHCQPTEGNNGSGECGAPKTLDPPKLSGTLEDVYEPADCVDYEVQEGNIDGELVIEAGVVAEFADELRLWVPSDGSLQVNGTADKPVVLRSMSGEPGSWTGVDIEAETDVSLQHCVIEDGGFGQRNTNIEVVRDTRLSLENCTIRDSSGTGLWLRGLRENAALVASSGNTFTKNEGAPVRLPMNFLPDLASDNDFTGNGQDRIEVTHANLDGVDVTIPSYEVPIHFLEPGGGVPANIGWFDGHVTVSPGATLSFGNSKGLTIRGEATATIEGTSDEPINFVPGGDGEWTGIHVEDAQVSFAHTKFSGGGSWDDGMDYLTDPGYISLTDSSSSDGVDTRVDLGEGMEQTGGTYGICFGNGDTYGEGPGCSTMTPIYRDDEEPGPKCN